MRAGGRRYVSRGRVQTRRRISRYLEDKGCFRRSSKIAKGTLKRCYFPPSLSLSVPLSSTIPPPSLSLSLFISHSLSVFRPRHLCSHLVCPLHILLSYAYRFLHKGCFLGGGSSFRVEPEGQDLGDEGREREEIRLT